MQTAAPATHAHVPGPGQNPEEVLTLADTTTEMLRGFGPECHVAAA